MEAKEEIRNRLNIEDVIGQYVQLKRAGRNFKGLSPFSQEKSPSFMVSPEKHIWHDFSSGKGGDVFTFVMEMEGVDFKGAMELLARKAGVDLAQYRQGSGDGGLGKKKDRLFAAMALATKFYQQVFVHSPVAIEYFKKRGMNKQVITDFGMGFSPTGDELYKALTKRGFTEKELRDAGLVVTRRGRPSDMFRGRMMVSLADPQGRPIGFTARIIADEPNAPKYINTPQTLLYDKGRHVFGLHLAKEAIRQKDCAVIVEGNMDVISSHQAGVKNVVATAGTALTEHHLRALSRFTQDVRLAFDADKAGIAATERAIAIASNLGITLGIIVLGDDAKDPDELIQKDVKLWDQAIDSPKDAVEWLLDVYASQYDFGTAEGKRKITDRVLGIVRGIEDPVLLEHYLNVVSKRIGSSYEALDKKLRQQPEPVRQKAPAQPAKPRAPTDPDKFRYQDALLAMAWTHPLLRDSLGKVEPKAFAGKVRQMIAAHLKDQAPLLQSDEIAVKINELELIAETKYPVVSDELYFVAADTVKKVQKEYKQTMRAELGKRLFATEDHTVRQTINAQIKQLDKEIEDLR
ncbi:MAG TPA: DNA primase [Candidatus Saccharimonadales bacterium]|nr:DNA primase [Candidatus Saccharimonadales bacterium]